MRPLIRTFLAVAVFFLSTHLFAQTAPAPDPATKAKLDALASISKVPDEGWRTHDGTLPHAEEPQLDDSSWTPVTKFPYEWTTGTVWFRRTVTIPKTLNGYDLTGATLWFQFHADSEDFTIQIVYFNGTRVAMGEDLEPIVLLKNAQPGQTIVIAVKAIAPPGVKTNFRSAPIEVRAAAGRPDPGYFREELRSIAPLLDALKAPEADQKHYADAIAAIDTNALARADQKAFDASLRAAQSALEPLNALLKQRSIRVTGNSHIDMGWLWPVSETTVVARDTFRTSLQLMNEYPDYTFTQSTAQMSEWMEEKYPQMFEQIKQRVKEGRWEIVGGMWVEPDLNMPDGESLVRQLLIGKRYFKRAFGVDVRIGWNPDSFGYNWQLPQIYKKSGMDYFVTQKLAWNDTNKPKHNLFWWQSPDGSRVLTYFPHDYANDVDPVRMANDLATNIRETGPEYTELMHLYGVGDHGGGPTRAMIDIAHYWENKDLVYPRVFFGTAQGFFDDLDKQVPRMNLPVVNNELYFEYHRGVMTSQAETKKGNRESEERMLNAEKWASLAHLAGEPYDGATFEANWKKVLFNQFHDIAAGSGIGVLYKDAARDYLAVQNAMELSTDHSLRALAARVNTAGPGVPVLVFNPLAWERDDVVTVEVQLPQAPRGELSVTDATGTVMPVGTSKYDDKTHRYTLEFLARGVPSLGYKLFRVSSRPVAKGPLGIIRATGKVGATLEFVNGKPSSQSIENQLLKLTYDAKTGCITSLIEKHTGKETINSGGCGNLLQAFVDKPKDWDAWNIDANFEDKKWDLTEAKSVGITEVSPLRAVLHVERQFQSSTLAQDIVVYDGIPRVDIVNNIDWHEKHILIKAAVPVTVDSPTATYEIPYGAIARPTTRNNSIEQAMFEVPALRWADLSDKDHGLSLLNDSKYGYDGKGNVLRLSLLRGPVWPDPNADQGTHTFTYSLYPHAGDWKQAQTVRRGYELNYKLQAIQVDAHTGALPAQHSFVSVDAPNVVLTAVKKCEDDDGLVLRFYEWAGKKTDVKLTLPPGATSAREANLMEAPGAALPITNGTLTVPTNPYEIKTIEVTFTVPTTSETKMEGVAPEKHQ